MAQPNFLKRPLGENADVNVLPDTNPDREGRATINKLFSAINSLPIKAGGIAPKRLDINALFKLLGADMWFNQHGGTYTYNKDYIYSLGAIIQIDSTFYVSIKGNNSNNTPSSSPNFWQKLFTIENNSIVLNNVVTLDTNQTINAEKTITKNFYLDGSSSITRTANVVKGETVDTDTWALYGVAQNKATLTNATSYARVGAGVMSNGSTRARIEVMRNVTGATTGNSRIEIIWDKETDTYTTYAPHPQQVDNSNCIATTQWTNNRSILMCRNTTTSTIAQSATVSGSVLESGAFGFSGSNVTWQALSTLNGTWKSFFSVASNNIGLFIRIA